MIGADHCTEVRNWIAVGSARMGRGAAGSGNVAVDRADYSTPLPRGSYAKSRLPEGASLSEPIKARGTPSGIRTRRC